MLDTFAADYRNRPRKIPTDAIQRVKDAKLATAGMFYRRQFAFADVDLAPADFGDGEGFGGSGVCIAINSETVTNLNPFASS